LFSPRAVAAGGIGLICTAIVMAALAGRALLLTMALGLAAGIGYNVELKRTRLSWLPWWTGLVALPLYIYVGADVLRAFPVMVLLFALPLALALHCANAIPDLKGDRAAGVRSLPAALGSERASWVVWLGVGALVLGVPVQWTLSGIRPDAAVLVVDGIGSLVALIAAAPVQRDRPRTSPLIAGSALVTLSWFASLPR
jgi:4-hydroxybenzoate polyprenyltransferase